jgi:DNA-binding IclR family transcriptional regulator
MILDMPPPTRSVDRALNLLVAITDQPDDRSLTALARQVDLSPSTASRLLETLAHHAFVDRVADGTYRPGARLLQVAASALQGEAVYELAEPHLVELASVTGETANLGIAIEGDRALYLRQVASPRIVRTASWTGRTIPIKRTAMGAALRGQVGPDGYASTRATVEPDVTAVAVPVRDRTHSVVAALSVLAPTYRTGDAEVEAIGRALVSHAGALSGELGAGSVGAAA